MPTPEVRVVPTPHGPGRLLTRRAPRPRATLALTHGAGRGVDTDDLDALSRGLVRHDVTVILVELPWVGAGRGIAPAPAVLDECFVAMLDRTRPRTPLLVGGRSAGARVACRTAVRVGAIGVLALAFPLHPPGRPEKSRAAELDAGVPVRVVQGERDAFGTPVELPVGTGVDVVPAADHSFRVPRRGPVSQDDALAVVVDAAARFVDRVAPVRGRGVRAGAEQLLTPRG